MSAQNCQARLLFSNFTLTLDYYWHEESTQTFEGGQSLHFELTGEGTWTSKPPKLDFTKRELSCQKFLIPARVKATDGWAHKQIDVPIVRDFSMGYPYPAFGQGEGQEYSAEYYVGQRYPNETGYTPEAVPLMDKIRERQPLAPILTQAWLTGPYYFLEESGFPPNLDQEHYALTPDTAVFDSKEAYKAWLQTWLAGTRSPVYFPGAPNDPNSTASPTLFPNKTDWLAFRDGAGGRGNGLCGGNAQCGVDFKLVRDEIAVITLTSLAESSGFPPSTGTAISKEWPVSLFQFGAKNTSGAFREIATDDDDKIKVSANGLPQFGPWKDAPDLPVGLAQYLLGYMGSISSSELDAISGSGFPFFNKKQKGCAQFAEAISGIDIAKTWTLEPKRAIELPWEEATPDFFPWNIGTADWDGTHDVFFAQAPGELSWTTSASSETGDSTNGAKFSMSCKLTITWTDL